jgi:hypothetical protein
VIVDSLLWNILHDGGIKRIDGSVPGTVALHISIRYLRSRFAGNGTGFVVRLSGCTHLTFQPYDEPPVSDLKAIVALAPEILGAEPSDPLEVACVMGTLFLRYEAAAISLDTGDQVTLSELDAASKSYWDEWSAGNRAR